MDLTRTRSLVLTATFLLGAAALAGCSSSTESVSSTGTSGGTRAADTVSEGAPDDPTTPVTAPSSVPGSQSRVTKPDGTPDTTVPDPNTVPPPTVPLEPSTIPATGQDPVLLDCGTIDRASGWPTTFAPNPEPFQCLQRSFDAGTPARMVDREQTDGEGGAILITTYDVLGAGRVRVTVDAREAADRPQGVTVSECTGLTTQMITVITSGCTVVSS